MTTESHAAIAFALCVALLFAATTLAQDPPHDEAWEPITVGDAKGYVVPNEVLEELGLPPRTLAPEDNAATYYLQAIEALNASWRDLDDRQLSDAFDKTGGANPPDRLSDPLLEWFQTTARGRDLIRKASALDRCQFPVIAWKPKEVLLCLVRLPHLAKMRRFEELMAIEGRVHEARGKPERAMESYLVTFRIAAHAGQGDSLIDGLLGVHCHWIGTATLEGLLAAESLHPEALGRLQQELQAIGPRLPARARWIQMECAASKQMVDLAMKDPDYAFIMLPFATAENLSANFPSAYASLMQSRAWRIVFPDRVLKQDFERFFADMAEGCASPPWQAVAQLRQRGAEARIADRIHEWNNVAWFLLPALDWHELAYVRMQTRHEALCLNVALRRYKAVHGTYPETLDALAPDCIDALPLDPLSGDPFHYRLDEGKWTLWSVGFDQDDDGGKTVEPRNWFEDADMVWNSAAEEGTK